MRPLPPLPARREAPGDTRAAGDALGSGVASGLLCPVELGAGLDTIWIWCERTSPEPCNKQRLSGTHQGTARSTVAGGCRCAAVPRRLEGRMHSAQGWRDLDVEFHHATWPLHCSTPTGKVSMHRQSSTCTSGFAQAAQGPETWSHTPQSRYYTPLQT